MKTLNFKPSVRIYLERSLLLALISSIVVAIVIYFVDSKLEPAAPLGTFVICFLVPSIVWFPMIIFMRLEVKKGRISYRKFLSTEEIDVQKITSIEEYWGRRGRRLMMLNTKDSKVTIPYRIFSEENIKEFVSELIKYNPKIKNDFDVVKVKPE